MSWVRIDDSFYDHPKFRRAGPLARDMWVQSLAYANKHLTDGFIAFDVVPLLGEYRSFNEYLREACGKPRWAGIDPYDVALRLCQVGLWDAAEDGFRIHDYLEFQPSAEQVRAQRQQAADRTRRWRDARRDARVTRHTSVRDGGVTSPHPTPPRRGEGWGSEEPSAVVSAPAPSGGADRLLPQEQVELNVAQVRKLRGVS